MDDGKAEPCEHILALMKRYIGKQLRQLEERIDKMPEHHVESFRQLAAGQDGQLDENQAEVRGETSIVINLRINDPITATKSEQGYLTQQMKHVQK